MQTTRSTVKDVQRDKLEMESKIIDILNKFEDEYGVELRLGTLTRNNASDAGGEIGGLNIVAVI